MGLLCVRVAVLCLLLLGSSELGLELSDLLVLLGLLDHDLLGLLGLGLIVASIPSRIFLTVEPRDLPSFGRFLGPKIIRTTTRIMMSSGALSPNM